MPMTVGEWARRRREELKLTQAVVSKRMGLNDRSYISKIEHDQSKQPSAALLVQLAQALDQPLSVLLDETGLKAKYEAETAVSTRSEGADLLVSVINTSYPHLTRDQAQQAMRFLGAVVGEQPPDLPEDMLHQDFQERPPEGVQ